MLKPGCWLRPIFCETRRTEAVERSGRHDRCSVVKSADASLADMNDPSLITVRGQLPMISPAFLQYRRWIMTAHP